VYGLVKNDHKPLLSSRAFFTSQLLASHCGDQRLEVFARQFRADPFKSLTQAPADGLLVALVSFFGHRRTKDAWLLSVWRGPSGSDHCASSGGV